MDLSKIQAPVVGLAFSPTGELAVACTDCVYIASPSGTARIAVGDKVTCIAFDTRRIAIGTEESLRIVQLKGAELGGKPRVTQIPVECRWHSMLWSPDGKHIVGGQYEPWVSVIDVDAKSELRVLDPDEFDDSGRTALVFVGATLYSTAYNKLVRWRFADVITNKAKCRMPKTGVTGHAHLLDLALLDDGSLVALADVEGSESFLQRFAPTGERLGKRIDVPTTSWRLGSLGDSVLVAGEDAQILAPDGTFQRSLEWTGEVKAVAISPELIAIGDARGVRTFSRR